MKRWFITGCSRGLGYGIAKAALQRGEQVALTARNLDDIRELEKAYHKQALAIYLT